MKKNSKTRVFMPYLILLIVITSTMFFFNMLNVKVNDIDYSEFIKLLNENKVTELEITPDSSSKLNFIEGKLKDYGENEIFKVNAPDNDIELSELIENAKDNTQ